jgi:hypothetical protein
MRTNSPIRPGGLLLGLIVGVAPLLGGCGQDTSTKVVPQNATTQQKNQEMQDAMKNAMKSGGKGAPPSPSSK